MDEFANDTKLKGEAFSSAKNYFKKTHGEIIADTISIAGLIRD